MSETLDLSTYTKRLMFLLEGGKLTTGGTDSHNGIYWDEDRGNVYFEVNGELSYYGMNSQALRDDSKAWGVYREPRTFERWVVANKETGYFSKSYDNESDAMGTLLYRFGKSHPVMTVTKITYTVP